MQTPGNTAIIVAAGGGSRFGANRPKQFLELRGHELLSYSVQTFRGLAAIDTVIIVTAADYCDRVTKRYPDCTVVPGGVTRQASVYNGLQACPQSTLRVLVHDAARPLVSSRIIMACLEKLKTCDGVAPASQPVDSMVQLQPGNFQNLDRNDLRIVQTPQCFRRDLLQQAASSGLVDTDEIGLVHQAVPEAQLCFVEGAPENLKITRALDLKLAELFLDLAAESS